MEFDFSKNYFEVFGLEAGYAVDKTVLDKSYQSLQAQFHPDKYANSDDQQRRLAMQVTSFINEAYAVLNEKQALAKYLLKLNGVDFDAEQDTTQDMEFLMAQMELREQIDEIDNNADPLQQLDEFAREAKQQKSELWNAYQQHFDAAKWSEAKDTVLKLQFFNRLQEQINQKQEQLEDELL